MRLRDQVIGTLNLFRRAPDGLDQPVARAEYARDHNRPLTALAGDVIHGTADISPGS